MSVDRQPERFAPSAGPSASASAGERPGGGHLLAQISKSIVAIMRDGYGRGPMHAKTYAIDDMIVVVMRGSGFTPLERTMMSRGNNDGVVTMRHGFQLVASDRFKETIERLTGRTVLAFLSQAHVEPDITVEIFVLDEPLDAVD